MRIGTGGTERELRRRRPARLPGLVWIGLAAGLVIWTGVVFLGGMSFTDYLRPEVQNLSGTTNLADALGALATAPERYVAALAAPPIDEIAIDIKFKNLLRLQEKRAEALRRRVLIAAEGDEVPATVTHDGRSVRVSLRLKGDWSDHFEGSKWSFRIQVKGGDQLFGMRRFSLQAPETRGFHTEIFFMDHLRREGVLALRYFFVDVTVNGRHVGLMAVEEHFGKELLESQQRREGVVVRFDESRMWDNVVSAGAFGPFDDYRNAEIGAFGSKKISNSPTLSAQRDVAIGLLRGFAEGALPASQVFDVEQMARFLAVAEVWRVDHGLRWHNLRFYLNPMTFRLEPVGFDANLQVHYVGRGLVTERQEQDLIPRVLEDPAIREAFVRNLRRIATDVVEGDLVAHMKELEEQQLAILSREYPLRAPYDFTPMVERARRLREITLENFDLFTPLMVDPERPYAMAVHAWLSSDDQGPYLELANALPVPVSVVSLGFVSGGTGSKGAWEGGLELPLALPPLRPGHGAPRVRLRYREPGGAVLGPGVEGVARVQGQQRPYAFRAQPYTPALDANPLVAGDLDEVLAHHPFLAFDAAAGLLRAEPGLHAVQGSLVLPRGIGLTLPPGTTLRFAAGEGILAWGPLRFEGTEQAPIVLEGPDSEDPASMWAGVVVLQSDAPSHWSWVEVRRTSGTNRGAWSVTAGVLFRRTTVTLEHCRLVGNRTEDAINLVHSHVEARGLDIHDTSSDAFDGDFIEGSIEGGTISDVGGDGIDVSGSRLRVEGVHLTRVHDKAVSVGEGSQLEAEGLDIREVGTAMASKDRSRGELSDSDVKDVAHVAFMAYVKKPEYGPAQLEARGNRLAAVAELAVAQTGSRVVVDGQPIPESDVDIEALYQGYMKK